MRLAPVFRLLITEQDSRNELTACVCVLFGFGALEGFQVATLEIETYCNSESAEPLATVLKQYHLQAIEEPNGSGEPLQSARPLG
jgi:hypothetical protein